MTDNDKNYYITSSYVNFTTIYTYNIQEYEHKTKQKTQQKQQTAAFN